MNVLIVHKSSNFELHKERFSSPVSDYDKAAENLQSLQIAHDEHYQCLARVREELTKAKISFTELLRGSPWPKGKFDVVFTVGGDGTLLSCSQQMREGGRIIGIRSSKSSIGYLCNSDCDGLEDLISRLLKNKLEFLQAARICARVIQVGKGKETLTAPVLNDILFTNSNPAATSRYSIGVDDHWETQKSSGIWISTAAGSTAGIAAAGGKIQKFTDKEAQYHVRELYRPKNIKFKLASGVFDPEKTRLRIENRSEEALIALDGQHAEVILNFGDMVEILRAPPQMIAKPESVN